MCHILLLQRQLYQHNVVKLAVFSYWIFTLNRYGDRRCLSVYKTKKKQNSNKDEDNTPCLTLSEEAKYVLQDLFTCYPPDEGELSEGTLKNCSQAATKVQQKPDSSFCKPSMRKAEIAKKVEMLAKRMNEEPRLRKVLAIWFIQKPDCFIFFLFHICCLPLWSGNVTAIEWMDVQIAEGRRKLPIASFKDVITSNLETQQVLIFHFAFSLLHLCSTIPPSLYEWCVGFPLLWLSCMFFDLHS